MEEATLEDIDTIIAPDVIAVTLFRGTIESEIAIIIYSAYYNNLDISYQEYSMCF